MPNTPEGTAIPAPTSDVAKQALAELEKEEAEKNPPAKVEENPKDPPAPEKPKEEKPKDEPKDPQKPNEDKPKDPPAKVVNRDVKVVPAWQKKVAESQSEAKDKEILELKGKLAQFEKQPTATQDQKQKMAEDIEKFLVENNVDDDNRKLLSGLADRLLSNFEGKVKVPDEIVKKLNDYETDKKVAEQETGFTSEFDTDIMPIIKAEYPHLSAEGLSEVKSKLHDLAFTEAYAKVSLKKIFLAEKDDLKIPPPDPKKPSAPPNKSGKGRDNEVIDFDNMDDETFASLSPEKALEYSQYMAKKGGKKWS